MAAILKRAAYVFASMLYMFLGSGYLWRARNAQTFNQYAPFFAPWGPLIEFSIVLVPLCIIAARGRPHYVRLALNYLGLIYLGILGQTIIGGDPLTFDAPPGFVPLWQTQVTNSFVFLAIFALINLLPTLSIFVIARSFVPHE